ncbi:MAG: hypothetical protein NW208_12895 [Bryobacter sp.]|nr:hypothetical protein [Bryobacter sp.]
MALEMKWDTNPRQLAFLAVLGVVLVYVVYDNYIATPNYGGGSTSPKTTAAPASPTAPNAAAVKRPTVNRRAQEFRPRVGPERPEDRPDPMSVDPTLRLELLARLQNQKVAGGFRSLFDFSNDPPPEAANPDAPKQVAARKPPPPPAFIGPMEKPPDPPPPPPPPKPVAPPIPLKYYGYVSSPGASGRKAFFLDGDDILSAEAGETLKQRYKVIRINLTSVLMEDTQFSQQQTLPIVPDRQPGGAE